MGTAANCAALPRLTLPIAVVPGLRRVCPNCGARRMAVEAARVVDRVGPSLPSLAACTVRRAPAGRRRWSAFPPPPPLPAGPGAGTTRAASLPSAAPARSRAGRPNPPGDAVKSRRGRLPPPCRQSPHGPPSAAAPTATCSPSSAASACHRLIPARAVRTQVWDYFKTAAERGQSAPARALALGSHSEDYCRMDGISERLELRWMAVTSGGPYPTRRSCPVRRPTIPVSNMLPMLGHLRAFSSVFGRHRRGT